MLRAESRRLGAALAAAAELEGLGVEEASKKMIRERALEKARGRI